MKVTKLFLYVVGLLILATSCGKSTGFAPSNASLAPTTIPSALVITSPVILSAVTNTALTITGQCQNGATVYLNGADTQQVACSASSFSFTITKTRELTQSQSGELRVTNNGTTTLTDVTLSS